MSEWLLFFSAFGAATLLPFYSEVTLLALVNQGLDPWWLWSIATLGNTLGAVVNFVIGRYLTHFEERRWFPFKAEKLHRAQNWFQRYGLWSLLLSWAPIGGDAITFVAGVMRVSWPVFLVLTTISKGGRYAVLLLIYLGFW